MIPQQPTTTYGSPGGFGNPRVETPQPAPLEFDTGLWDPHPPTPMPIYGPGGRNDLGGNSGNVDPRFLPPPRQRGGYQPGGMAGGNVGFSGGESGGTTGNAGNPRQHLAWLPDGNTGIVPPYMQQTHDLLRRNAPNGVARGQTGNLPPGLAQLRNQLGVGQYQEGPNAAIVNQFRNAGASQGDILAALRGVQSGQGDFSGGHGAEQRQALEQWKSQHGMGNTGRGWGAKAQNQPGYQRSPQFTEGGPAPRQTTYGVYGPRPNVPSGGGIPVSNRGAGFGGSMGSMPQYTPGRNPTSPLNITRGSTGFSGGMSSNDPRNRTPMGGYGMTTPGQRIYNPRTATAPGTTGTTYTPGNETGATGAETDETRRRRGKDQLEY